MENLILIDWLSFSIRRIDQQNETYYTLIDILELLGLSDFENLFESCNGFYGYKERIYYGGISIHTNNPNTDTYLIEMSGKGCRTFETYSKSDFTSLFLFLYHFKHICNVTRLDIAYDDFGGLLQKDVILKHITSRFYITKFKSIYSEISYTADDWTLYFGSKKSDVMFRLYDKAAERDCKDKIPHWLRWEIQLRDDFAREFLNKIIAEDLNIGAIFKGVLYNYLRFCKETKDTNKQRWKLAKWYADFLGSVAKIKLWTPCDVDYNFQRLQDYIQINCGNAIDAFIKIKGIDYLQKVITARPTKANPKYLRLINESKAVGNEQ